MLPRIYKLLLFWDDVFYLSKRQPVTYHTFNYMHGFGLQLAIAPSFSSCSTGCNEFSFTYCRNPLSFFRSCWCLNIFLRETSRRIWLQWDLGMLYSGKSPSLYWTVILLCWSSSGQHYNSQCTTVQMFSCPGYNFLKLYMLWITLSYSPGQLVAAKTGHFLLSYSQQIAFGMHYLSNKGFVHRDLAARNVLVSRNNICKVYSTVQ